jgi:hypothetical protein
VILIPLSGIELMTLRFRSAQEWDGGGTVIPECLMILREQRVSHF